MAIVKEKYAAPKINLLYQLLQGDAEEGRPREYDIAVDDLKVVRRTTDPERFFAHEDFIREDTRSVTITLYEGTSKRNTRYIYYLRDGEADDRGSLAGIEQSVNEKMQRERQQWNYELLQKENEELKSDIEEQEKYIEELQVALNEERNKKASIKSNWGEVFSIALEGMVRRNTHLLGNIPMIGEGLAGAVELDNQRRESAVLSSPQAVGERAASFQKVSAEDKTGCAKTKDDEQTLEYFSNLRKVFTDEEMTKLLEIIGLLSCQKHNVDTVLDMLKEDPAQ